MTLKILLPFSGDPKKQFKLNVITTASCSSEEMIWNITSYRDISVLNKALAGSVLKLGPYINDNFLS